jgi:regulator of protease activity HflC (stomatin/prohibitin superfamily)
MYELPGPEAFPGLRRLFGLARRPNVEVVLVDLRARDLTIKGQEILTADKVAIPVSILVQFAVVDLRSALHAVANYEDRLHSDSSSRPAARWRR